MPFHNLACRTSKPCLSLELRQIEQVLSMNYILLQKRSISRCKVRQMRTYENLLQPVDEWFITSTLNLDDNGRFRYHEEWSCYAGSTNGKAEGKWLQTEEVVMLETEHLEGPLQLSLVVGEKFKALDRGDCLDFGNGFEMIAQHT